MFGFAALSAVILNKAMSLVVVIPDLALIPALAIILLISAIKIARPPATTDQPSMPRATVVDAGINH